jgi:predicted RNase H-like nuclease (RuvC/YqgF family)
MSEGSKNNSEGNENPVDINELSAKLQQFEQQLEAEKKSKERILEESKKYKEGFQTYKAKEEEARKAEQLREEERLKKEGQFSTIIEQREQRIKGLEEDLQNMRKTLEGKDTAIVNFRKATAFERALGGKMKQEAYWNHVDFNKIAVNPETGKIDEISLKEAADNFIESHKELIDFGSTANLPNSSASGKASGKLTYEQWQKLPTVAEKKKRMKDVIK